MYVHKAPYKYVPMAPCPKAVLALVPRFMDCQAGQRACACACVHYVSQAMATRRAAVMCFAGWVLRPASNM